MTQAAVEDHVGGRAWVSAAAALVVTAIAFAAAYGEVCRLLVLRWYNNDFYSYAFLIPLISAYMLWSQRERVAGSVGPPDHLLGVPILVVSLAALLVGRAGSFAVLQQLSIVPALAGIVLLCAGRQSLRAVALPLLYLLFAVPLWDVFTDPMHEPFQRLSAHIGQWGMTAMGVPSYLNDKILQLPNVTLEVARACSGINYLISVIAIAIPYSFLSLSRTTRRVAVIGFAVVVAILSNGLRVALVGALQYYQLSSPGQLHGPYHVLQGMFVAVVGYAALFAGAWFLRERDDPSRQGPSPAAAATSSQPLSWKPAALATGILFVAAVLVVRADPLPVPVADSNWWPEVIGEWRAGGAQVESGEFRADRPDAEFSRRYQSPGGDALDVYIAYFSVQKEGRKVMGFGGVALPDSASRVVVPGADGSRPKVAFIEKVFPSGSKRYVMAWYDLDGITAANVYSAKLVTLWNSVVHRRSNGAAITLTLDGQGVAPDRARAVLQAFAADMLPAARRFLASGAAAR